MAEQKGPGATARRKQTILHLLRSCRSALGASQQPTQSPDMSAHIAQRRAVARRHASVYLLRRTSCVRLS